MLSQAGVTNFTPYAVDPTSPLMQDLFVPDTELVPSAGIAHLTADFFKAKQ